MMRTCVIIKRDILFIVGSADFSDPNRTFFCSELVAAVYKEVGLLRPDVASTSYTPADFTEDNVTFLNGVTLGPPERVILPTFA